MACNDGPFLAYRTCIASSIAKAATIFYSSVFSPDDRYLITGTNEGNLVVWDIEALMQVDIDKPQLCPVANWHAHKRNVYALAFCGDTLLSGADDCIHLWDWNSLVTSHFSTHSMKPTASLSPESNTFLHGTETNGLSVDTRNNVVYAAMGDGKAYAWDLYRGECAGTFEGHTDYLHCLKVDPQNDRLFTGSEDATVRIWDLRTNSTEFILESWKASATQTPSTEKVKDWISALDLSSTSNWLACGGASGLHIWYLSYLKYCTHVPVYSVQAVMFQDAGVSVAGNGPVVSNWALDGKLQAQTKTGINSIYSLSSQNSNPSVIVATGNQISVSTSITHPPVLNLS